MKLSYFLTPLALVMGVTAVATPKRNYNWQNCVSQAEAESIVAQYVDILSHQPSVAAANATAQALLADGYEETSDSILSLEGLPLGTPTFVGKDTYITGTLFGPPVVGAETIAVYVANCNYVLWQWVFTGIGSGQYEVKGFNLFDITADLQIQNVHLEFNSIAWGLDTGYQVIFPPPPSMSRRSRS